MVASVQHIGSVSKDFTVEACLVSDDGCATLKMEVDTKSDITGIPKSMFYSNFGKTKPFPYRQRILNFDNTEIKGIIGWFRATIIVSDKHTEAQVIILPDNVKPILVQMLSKIWTF